MVEKMFREGNSVSERQVIDRKQCPQHLAAFRLREMVGIQKKAYWPNSAPLFMCSPYNGYYEIFITISLKLRTGDFDSHFASRFKLQDGR